MEVDWDRLPSGPHEWFHGEETAFPTPDEIRARIGGSQEDRLNAFRPRPERFAHLDLIVKWGKDVTIAEGQCLWFIGKKLGKSAPVPKVLGWKENGGQVFIYMELIHGDTLMDRWVGLPEADRVSICTQLSTMIQAWRQIKQPGKKAGHCQIGGQALRDIMFYDGGVYPAGPFANTTEFHKAFGGMVIRKPKAGVLPWGKCEELAGLKAEVPVVFTHSDLDQSNILISKAGDGPVRIVAIIDWHQSGWYPEHWERLKAQAVARPECDWREEYVPRVLEEAKFEYYYSWEYVNMGII